MQDLQRSTVYVLQLKDLAEKRLRGRGGARTIQTRILLSFSPHSQIFSLRTLRLCRENASRFIHLPTLKNCIIMHFSYESPFQHAL
jgi:hypothetical protein